jgi:hypothetical protein
LFFFRLSNKRCRCRLKKPTRLLLLSPQSTTPPELSSTRSLTRQSRRPLFTRSNIFYCLEFHKIKLPFYSQDEEALAFRDISPQAPTHVLVIPKKRSGLTQLTKATPEHKQLLGHVSFGHVQFLRDSIPTLCCCSSFKVNVRGC